MRVRDVVYHVNCFTCASCSIPLSKGDHFGMRDGLVYCWPHYELACNNNSPMLNNEYCDPMEIHGTMFRASSGSPASTIQYHMSPSPASVVGTQTVQKGRPRKRKIQVGADSPGATDLSNVNMRMTAGGLGKYLIVM